MGHGRRVELDRIEGEMAVLLDPGADLEVVVPRVWLPEGAQEGAVLHLSLLPDPEATAALREQVGEAQRRLLGESGPMDSGTLEL